MIDGFKKKKHIKKKHISIKRLSLAQLGVAWILMDRWIREVNVGKISWRSFTSGGDGSSRLSLMCQRSKNTLVVLRRSSSPKDLQLQIG